MEELLSAYSECDNDKKRKNFNSNDLESELKPPKKTRRILDRQEVHLCKSSYIPKKKRNINESNNVNQDSTQTINQNNNSIHFYTTSIPHEIWKQIHHPKDVQHKVPESKFPHQRINGHEKDVTDLKWSPCNGKYLLSCGNDNLVKLWNLFEENTLKGNIIHEHEKGVREIDWNISGILSCSWDKSIAFCDPITCTSIRTFNFDEYPSTVQWNSVDKNLFINGSYNSEIYCWDIRAPE